MQLDFITKELRKLFMLIGKSYTDEIIATWVSELVIRRYSEKEIMQMIDTARLDRERDDAKPFTINTLISYTRPAGKDKDKEIYELAQVEWLRVLSFIASNTRDKWFEPSNEYTAETIKSMRGINSIRDYEGDIGIKKNEFLKNFIMLAETN